MSYSTIFTVCNLRPLKLLRDRWVVTAASKLHLVSATRAITTSTLRCAQNKAPAAYYRGGTSRAVFFQEKHLPTDRSQWNFMFPRVIGSPDPYGRQLDGMGGGISSLSKICVVGPSEHPEADVDYTFAAIGVDNADVDLSSNCGNMTSAVGPFAVDAGIFKIDEARESAVEVTVRIHNTNTGKIIYSSFPVADGEAESRGDFTIDGVAGTAARVQLDFVNPAGSKTGKLLPTGSVIDTFDGTETTCVDVGNPCCFVEASALGVDGRISPVEIEKNAKLMQQLESIRRQAGVKMGLADELAKIPGSIPKIGMVSPPNDADRSSIDLRVRALSVGQPHKAVPITVALALAAASKLHGSVVQRCTSSSSVNPDGIVLGHASGKLMVGATFNEQGEVTSATVFRTARRLMEGMVFWK